MYVYFNGILGREDDECNYEQMNAFFEIVCGDNDGNSRSKERDTYERLSLCTWSDR